MLNLKKLLTKMCASFITRNDIVVESVSKNVGQTYNTNASGSVDIPVAKTGYTALGIVGFEGSGTGGFAWQDWSLLSGNATARLYFRNISTTSTTLTSVRVFVLYLKTWGGGTA